MGRIAILAVFAGVISGCAHVPPTQSWPGLVRRVGPGTPVGVTDAAAIGALGAALPDNRCSGHPPRCDDTQISERLTFLAAATAAGIAIDALRRDRTTLYGSPNRLTLRVIPTLASRQKALSVAIAFTERGAPRRPPRPSTPSGE